MSGDGRLDLDDLGQVVENATPLRGGSERDELVAGDDGPTWGERTAPARAWLHRHRVPVALVAASALVLGLGAAAWRVRQPPPQATELAVSLLFPVDQVGVEFLEDSVVRLSVEAEARRAGETVRVLGVVGTGLAASRTSSTGPGSFEVRALVDCGLEPDLVTGTAATEHLVEVETTDAYGRTLRGRLPMVGVSDSLGFQLAQHCAQVMTDAGVITQVTSARRDGNDLALTVAVRNDTPTRVLLATSPMSGTVDVRAPVVGVPPGRSRFWDVSLALTDCAAPQLQWVTPDGSWVEVEGTTLLSVGGIGVAGAEPVLDAQASFVTWSSSEDPLASMYQGPSSRPIGLGSVTPAIRAWARELCAGAEPVTASARPEGPGFVPAEGPARVAIPVRVDVALPAAGEVTVAPVVDPENTWASRLSPRGAPDAPWRGGTITRGDAASLRLLWMVSCDGDLSPPGIVVTVRADGRETPWRLVLDDSRLADALVAACPAELGGVDTLSGWGWDGSDGQGSGGGSS